MEMEIDQQKLDTQTKLMYLIMPMIDAFITESVNNEWIGALDSGAFVMNIITNLINMLIRNSYNNGANKSDLAKFLKEGLVALGAHMLEKLKELPDVEEKELPGEAKPETTH